MDDKTVNISATIAFMQQQGNPLNKLIIYTTDAKKMAQDYAANNIEWIDSVVSEQKILSSAHTAILVAPDDAHYGMNGEYVNCIHYYPQDMDKYETCMTQPQDCWQGEVTAANMNAVTLRRLMYNPHFSELQDSLKLFIAKMQ
jgi:hypothetical protein